MISSLHKVADGILKKIHRSPMYYRRFNNTLEFKMNRTYEQYARECAKRYAETNKEPLGESPLKNVPAVCLKNVFDTEKAKALSAKITNMIDNNDPNVYRSPHIKKKQVIIQYPLETLGQEYLNVLRNPTVDAALKNFFRGNYAMGSVMAFRSLPSDELVGSWLWHSDCYPPFTCKLFLHLTPANADLGATEFLGVEDTMSYRDAGYFGQMAQERRSDLDVFAKEHNLPYRPFRLDAQPGDATIFNMNYFHRAVSPRRDFRDVLEIFLLPSPIPWDEHFKQHADYLRQPQYGFPKNPRVMVGSSAPAMMM